MSRVIDLKVSRDGELWPLGWDAADLLGWGWDRRRQGVRVSGCGMDMGFHLVYTLSRVLFPDGFGLPCSTEGCEFRPATREEALQAEEVATPGVTPHEFRGRNGSRFGWDGDGGYALRHEWI